MQMQGALRNVFAGLVLLDVHKRSIGNGSGNGDGKGLRVWCKFPLLRFLITLCLLSRSVSASSVCRLLQLGAFRSSALGGSLSMCSSQQSAEERCREAVQGFCAPACKRVVRCSVRYVLSLLRGDGRIGRRKGTRGECCVVQRLYGAVFPECALSWTAFRAWCVCMICSSCPVAASAGLSCCCLSARGSSGPDRMSKQTLAPLSFSALGLRMARPAFPRRPGSRRLGGGGLGLSGA